MPDPVAVFEVRTRGLWNTRHAVSREGHELGVLTVNRRPSGVVEQGVYSPEKGEVLTIRRDPGLLRSQFSLWTDGREWLGSSLRWSLVRREIILHTGSKPLRVLPVAGLGFGWTLVAPRTGQMARVVGSPRLPGTPLGARSRIEVFRKMDFELAIFTYFLGRQILWESLWPRPRLASEAPSGATARA